MTSMVQRFFADVKSDKAQAVKASLLSNSGLATAVHPASGQTALQVAVQSAGESVIRALRRHGARWTDVDNAGNNAVHYVSKAGRSDLCKTRKSADWVMALHQPNAGGETPLHATLAAPESSATADIIHAFVHVGADINRRNAEGKSALDLAEDRLHLVQMMHEAAGASLGQAATATQSVMGTESLMGGGSFIGGSVGGGPLIPVESGMYSADGGRPQERGSARGRSSQDQQSRNRSSSVAADRPPGAKARSPVRRSPSVFSDHAVDAADRTGSVSVFSSRRTGEPAPSRKQSTSHRRNNSSILQQGSANGSRSEMDPRQGQGLAWMGGGQTWGGFAEQDHGQGQDHGSNDSPASSARRRDQITRPTSTSSMLRHPAPIRTSVRSSRSMQDQQSNMSDYEGDRGAAQGYAGNGAMPNLNPAKSTAEANVTLDEVNMHTNAMHAQLDNGASVESDSDPSLHRYSTYGAPRMQRNNSVRQVGRGMPGRDASIDEDGLPAPDSPQASLMSSRTQRGAGSNRERPRSTTLAAASGNFSAMSDYDPNGGRREPPLAPGMRSQVRSIRTGGEGGSGDRMRGHSPRRAPATPGSVRSTGTANGSARGERRSTQDQVRQMQHALEKAASAMRQLQEDRKADSSELSDFAKCMDAMTERMDIMDRAMQKVVDEQADNAHHSGADYEARDDIEKLADSVHVLESQAEEMKQWLRDNDDKLGDCWGQLEDLTARVGGETRSGGIDGLAGVMDALEATVTEMKSEMKSIREQQQRADTEQATRAQQSDGDGEAVHATLAELKKELQEVRQGQQRTEEQASKALKASEGSPGVGAAAVGALGAGGALGAVGMMAAGSSSDVGAEEFKEVKQQAQGAQDQVETLKEDVEDVKGAMLRMKEFVDQAKGDVHEAVSRVDQVHGEQKSFRGQLTEISAAVSKLQQRPVQAGAAAAAAAPATAQADTREAAQEAAREVATDVAHAAARQTATEVAREVAQETAMRVGAEAAQAAVQESAASRDADISSLSEPSTPRATASMPEVLERLQEMSKKVELLEDRVEDVAAGAKGSATADVRGVGASSGGSGGSYSPPRTPDAAAEARTLSEKQGSLDMGSDGGVLPAEVPVREREVSASKATLYTNVYSGPSQSLEYSEFSEQLLDVKNVAEVASKDIVELRGDIDKMKLKLKDSQLERQAAPAAPKTLGSGFDDDQASSAQEARLKEIQGVALRADAAREETEETLGIMESRLDRAEHNIQLLQHAVHQHDERIAGFMYSPARNSVAEGSYALKSTVEALESKIMQVEVQYAGRLQAQKAKNDQQGALIQGLLERVTALEHRDKE